VLVLRGWRSTPTCARIEVEVDEAGSYVIEIEKRNIDGADRGTAGDFYLRSSLVP
jgi:hypothetical protein